MKGNKIKLFVAIPVPADLKEDLNKFIETNSEIANIRWISEKNWHLTLFFIGFINEEKLNSVNEKIRIIISQIKPFPLNFEKYSLEGKPARASMIWARFQNSDIFTKTSNDIAIALKDELEQVQNFKRAIPHITLARLRKSVKRNAINLNLIPEIKKIEVTECQLWQSIGTTSGMIYESLFEYSLSG